MLSVASKRFVAITMGSNRGHHSTVPSDPILPPPSTTPILEMDDGGEDNPCAVCFEPLTTGYRHWTIGTTSCGHCFHEICYNRWIASSCHHQGAELTCPTCKHAKPYFTRIRLTFRPKQHDPSSPSTTPGTKSSPTTIIELEESHTPRPLTSGFPSVEDCVANDLWSSDAGRVSHVARHLISLITNQEQHDAFTAFISSLLQLGVVVSVVRALERLRGNQDTAHHLLALLLWLTLDHRLLPSKQTAHVIWLTTDAVQTIVDTLSYYKNDSVIQSNGMVVFIGLLKYPKYAKFSQAKDLITKSCQIALAQVSEVAKNGPTHQGSSALCNAIYLLRLLTTFRDTRKGFVKALIRRETDLVPNLLHIMEPTNARRLLLKSVAPVFWYAVVHSPYHYRKIMECEECASLMAQISRSRHAELNVRPVCQSLLLVLSQPLYHN